MLAAASRERGRRWQAAEPWWRGGDCRRLPSFYLLLVLQKDEGVACMERRAHHLARDCWDC